MERHDFVRAFAIPSPEPALEAIASMRDPIEAHGGHAVDWDAFDVHVRRLIESVLESEGVFRTEIVGASFVCAPPAAGR